MPNMQDANRSAATKPPRCFKLSPELAFGATLLLYACGDHARGEWRDQPGFNHASEQIESLLTEPAAAAWRTAVADAPNSARLAEPLRTIGSRSNPDYAEALAGADAPPGWLTQPTPGHGSLRLAAAEALASERRHDACLAWLDGVDPLTTFSPTLCEYLRLVAHQQTVDDGPARECLERLDVLLADAPTATLGPARRWVVDTVRRELQQEPKPLPNITRRMLDVERRLAQLGVGPSTQDRQQVILDELDKLIEQLEEQRKQQQQQLASGSPAGQDGSAEPAEESRPGELKGSGEVDRKRLVSGDAWGALPAAERARLTQEITRDFPPHYRGLIEDYFRTLAEPPADPHADTRP